ncbi:hypothetical protein L3Y34_002547 [Caenorhabditis briggsae]|uniref:C2H2-type domain-containing protein n=1 Tax=Caenorhabditis briggsae TaxID=6238 RepID=A0AAE9DGA2_CAEBR|nr:hypothetical protein L3Y34_002547 [Caenorhabditis briggsae]
MAHLVCPMCSETLSEEGSHFFKHFKYKRYACGENDCTHQFYTEAERNAHCSANNHKRSFQKTVNPYIDRMITQLVEDAKHLAMTNDMEVVIANRWGGGGDSESHSELLKTSEVVKQRKKRVTSSSSSTMTPVTKKTRTTPAVKISTSPFAFLSSSTTTSGAASSSSNINPPTPPTPSPTATVQPAPSSSAIVDSTTSDHNIPIPPAPPPPTTRKPRNQRQSESCSTGPHNQTYEEMSALDKLIGWFDPNVPERQDAAKIKCSVCHKEIVYDYIIRKGHVTRDHMAADVAPQDYDDILKSTMDRCYPEMPNSSLACQLCMTGSDVRKTLRREHIEKFHTTSLPPLTCPLDGCGKGFRRQCDLSSHMKEIHKARMSIHKDQTFQNIRRRRNGMINEMINKCFPWSSLEAMENKAIALNKSASSTPSLATPTDLSKDVRLRDANKTRRAPQYNTTGSSSSSSSSDSEDESTTLATVEDPNGTPIDFSRDVIYICHQFNAEVTQKLSERAAPMLVKREARAEAVVLNDEPMEEEPEDDVKEEEEQREEMEVPKVEDVVQSPQVYGNGPRSPYEPIVPPPSESPPDPLNSRVESSAVYSTERTDYRSRSPSSRSSRPPSRAPRSPSFYQPRRSNSRSSTTSYHRNRPYNPSIAHHNNPRGYSGGSSSSSRHYPSSFRSGGGQNSYQNSYSGSSSRHRGSSEYNSRSSNSSHSWRSFSNRNDNRNNSSGNGCF